MNQNPPILDGTTLGSLAVALLTNIYLIFGSALPERVGTGVAGAITTAWVLGFLIYRAILSHGWFNSPAQLAHLGLLSSEGDGAPVEIPPAK